MCPMQYGPQGILQEKMLGLRAIEEEFGGKGEGRGPACAKAQGPDMACPGWRNVRIEQFELTLKVGCTDPNLIAERDLRDPHLSCHWRLMSGQVCG